MKKKIFTFIALLTLVFLAWPRNISPQYSNSDEPISFSQGLKGYEVHEWGVFGVYPNFEVSNAEMKAEWASLPKGIYRSLPKWEVPKAYHGDVTKPVIYFHTKNVVDKNILLNIFSATIQFSEGRHAVWFPICNNIYLETSSSKITKNLDVLSWSFYFDDGLKHQLKPPMPPQWTSEHYKKVPDMDVNPSHWYQELRNVNADEIFAMGAHSYHNGGQDVPYQKEKFIYYDGLIKPLDHLSCKRISKNTLEIISTAPYDLHGLYAVENRADGLWLCFLDKVPSEQRVINIKLKKIALDQVDKVGKEHLVKRLLLCGLHLDEAESMAKIWNPGFFKKQGLTLFYRLPQHEYSRVTRISLKPLPEKLVRVGIILHSHMEPELPGDIDNLINKILDDNKEQDRIELKKYGASCLHALKQKLKNTKSPEIKKQSLIKEMIATIEASIYIEISKN